MSSAGYTFPRKDAERRHEKNLVTYLKEGYFCMALLFFFFLHIYTFWNLDVIKNNTGKAKRQGHCHLS